MIWLLIPVVVLGVLGVLLGVLIELTLHDTRRTQAVADAALRRALEPFDSSSSRSPPAG